MTSLSFLECCHLLAIDPKTLRQWLAQAKMSLHAHPTDARVKCLTSEQVHEAFQPAWPGSSAAS